MNFKTLLCVPVFVFAQEDLDLSGHINDAAGHPLSGIEVDLVEFGLKDTTDVDGNWSFFSQSSSAKSQSNFAWSQVGEMLLLDLPTTTSVQLTVLDPSGRAVLDLMDRYLAPGRHNIDLMSLNLPFGQYYLRLRMGSKIQYAKLSYSSLLHTPNLELAHPNFALTTTATLEYRYRGDIITSEKAAALKQKFPDLILEARQIQGRYYAGFDPLPLSMVAEFSGGMIIGKRFAKLGLPQISSNGAYSGNFYMVKSKDTTSYQFSAAVESYDQVWQAGSALLSKYKSDSASFDRLTAIVPIPDFGPGLVNVIDFPQISDRIFGDAPFVLAPTASSLLPVTLQSNSLGVCTMSGDTVNLIGIGTCALTASQAGNAYFKQASQVQRSFVINAKGFSVEVKSADTLWGKTGLSQINVPKGALSTTVTAIPGLNYAVKDWIWTPDGGIATILSACAQSLNCQIPAGMVDTTGTLTVRFKQIQRLVAVDKLYNSGATGYVRMSYVSNGVPTKDSGDALVDGKMVDQGSVVVLEAVPGVGSAFANWDTLSGYPKYSNSNYSFVVGTASRAIVGAFKKASYLVSASLDTMSAFGSFDQNSQMVVYGSDATFLLTITNVDYEVKKWYWNNVEYPACGVSNVCNVTGVLSAGTLRAELGRKKNTLSLAISGGSGLDSIFANANRQSNLLGSSVIVDQGVNLDLLAVSGRGYALQKWTETKSLVNTDLGVLPNLTYLPKGSATLTAVLAKRNYQISVRSSNEQMGTVDVAQLSVPYKSVSVIVNALPKTGYRVEKWTWASDASALTTDLSSCGNSPNCQIPVGNVDSTGVLTCIFKPNQYVVNYTVSPISKGTISAGLQQVTGNVNYGFDSLVHLSTSSIYGWKFSSWTTTNSLSIVSNDFRVPVGGADIQANFIKDSMNLSASAVHASFGSVSPLSQKVEFDANGTVIATPTTASDKLDRWLVNGKTFAASCSFGTPCNLIQKVDSNYVVQGIFKRKQTLQWITAPTSAQFRAANVSVKATTNAGAYPLVYSVVSGPCTINASTGSITLTSGTGSCVVKAVQVGDTLYYADSITTSITALKAPTTLRFDHKLADLTFSSESGSAGWDPTFTPHATTMLATPLFGTTALSGLTVTYESLTQDVCKPSAPGSNSMLILGFGKCQYKAVTAGNSDYAGSTKDTSFEVKLRQWTNEVYKAARIGTQTWMAENLRGNLGGALCAGGNCASYGYYYPWNASGNYCPTGWHLPTYDEWRILKEYVVANSNGEAVGTSLRSTNGWDSAEGFDLFGFNGQPNGSLDGYSGVVVDALGTKAMFWASTESSQCGGEYMYLSDNNDDFLRSCDEDGLVMSVRCVQTK